MTELAAPKSMEKACLKAWPEEGLESIKTCPVCDADKPKLLYSDLSDKTFKDRRLQRSFLPFDNEIGDFSGNGHIHKEVDFVLGAAMLLRKNHVEAIGGFDEDFFLYGEDEDLCLRIRNSKKRILVIRGAEAIHFYGSSTAGNSEITISKAWHLGWSRMRFAHKHHG
jgi:GT2 family glycosyltransferase